MCNMVGSTWHWMVLSPARRTQSTNVASINQLGSDYEVKIAHGDLSNRDLNTAKVANTNNIPFAKLCTERIMGSFIASQPSWLCSFIELFATSD